MMTSQITLGSLKSQTLPALFRDPSTLGQYGSPEANAAALEACSAVIERGDVSQLAEKIAQLVTALHNARPEQMAKAPTWRQRIFGAGLESKVRYRLARKDLENLLNECEGAAQAVRDTLRTLGQQVATHREEDTRLQLHIQAGREYLDEHPEAGADRELGMGARERFARKLVNLAALQASHTLSIQQLQLTQANAIDLLDRYEQTAGVLVPIWRQTTLSLITAKHMSPEMVKAATTAHDALVRSLSPLAH